MGEGGRQSSVPEWRRPGRSRNLGGSDPQQLPEEGTKADGDQPPLHHHPVKEALTPLLCLQVRGSGR